MTRNTEPSPELTFEKLSNDFLFDKRGQKSIFNNLFFCVGIILKFL